jgi:secreted trypsin-like serine protease
LGRFETENIKRIIGGEIIDITSVPYFVALELYNSQRCGGSIISNSWIITAAHCIHTKMSDLRVRSGSSHRSSGGYIQKLEKVFIHPNYKAVRKDAADYDFALLKLKSPIIYDKTRQPIKLADSSMYEQGDEALVSGFGLTNNPKESNEVLRAVVLEVTSDEGCINRFIPTTPSMVCAKAPNKSACSGNMKSVRRNIELVTLLYTFAGDSGGPLVSLKHGTLLGVVSFGDNGCVHPVYPTVFGRISEAREWINDVIEKY